MKTCVLVVLPVAGMMALMTSTSCSSAPPAAAVVAAAPSNPPVSPLPVDERVFIATGPIVVENQVDVLALRPGVVAKIVIDVGQTVHKGDLLASLDDREATAERDAAAARMHSAESNLQDWEAETGVADSDYRRAQAMRDAGINTQEELDHAHYKLIGSQFEVDKAKQDLSNAQNTLRVLDLELEKTRICAPFDGVVARRYVRDGQSVAVGDRLFWVTSVAPLEVRFTVPEQRLGAVTKGQTVKVASADIPSAVEHPAKIMDVSPVVDPSSGTIEVMAQVVGMAADLRPGMLAHIRIDLRPTDSVK
ncbi:MAG TPA: efflux RND transporter periplasmic adaptor subunit [Terriglobales bacterium]